MFIFSQIFCNINTIKTLEENVNRVQKFSIFVYEYK